MGEYFLGIELGGSKSRRTSLVALEYFPQENRIFLAEICAHPEPEAQEDSDEMLVRLASERNYRSIAFHAPLTLPPCIGCELKCPGIAKCKVPSVLWMRERNEDALPYVQRPVDLWLRERWHADWQDSLGAASAPMAARMQYLKKHLNKISLVEVRPRAALLGLAPWYKISQRELRRFRNIEAGIEIRSDILEKLGALKSNSLPQIFLYQSDAVELAKDLAAFDAFLCALLAVWARCGWVDDLPLRPEWGGILIPKEVPSAKKTASRADEEPW